MPAYHDGFSEVSGINCSPSSRKKSHSALLMTNSLFSMMATPPEHMGIGVMALTESRVLNKSQPLNPWM